LRVGVHHDIMCHYSIQMWQRWAALPPPSQPLYESTFEQFVPAIGKFHLAAHQESCYALYSLNRIKGVGRVDGEGSERCWSDLNKAASSSSEWGPGSRIDSLNHVMQQYNWSKVVTLGT
jgi:hypothetical protein